jgi:tetratricopeptide (TPR) repeat protein
MKKLGRDKEATERLTNLFACGGLQLEEDIKIDYFAISLPNFLLFNDDLAERNVIQCHYLRGVAQLGLGNTKEALEHFKKVLKLDINHIEAQNILTKIEF